MIETDSVRIKALSVKQPWANMIANGEKTIETRLWKTPYRGELLICSSKDPDIYPAGFALAIVRLVWIGRMSEQWEAEAKCPTYAGAYAWHLEDARKIVRPFRVKGRQRLFEIEVPGDVKTVPMRTRRKAGC